MSTHLFTDAINGVILNSSNQIRLMPSWIANEAFQILDPQGESPYPIRVAATEHLKQIARQQLRGKFEPDTDDDIVQHEMFPGLQDRYPAAKSDKDGEPVYVSLPLLTDEDIAWNVQRLRREGKTKLQHATRLERFGQDRAGKKQAA